MVKNRTSLRSVSSGLSSIGRPNSEGIRPIWFKIVEATSWRTQ